MLSCKENFFCLSIHVRREMVFRQAIQLCKDKTFREVLPLLESLIYGAPHAKVIDRAQEHNLLATFFLFASVQRGFVKRDNTDLDDI